MSQEEFTWRGVNFWAHIKNWYEVHSLEDNQQLLREIAGMGFNDFWITFERGLVNNYLDPEIADEYSRRFWHKLGELAKTAKQLGMRVTILDEINTVFLDQYHAPENENLIAEGPKTYPSLKRPWQFCPSKPEAREIIMKNHEESIGNFPVIDALVLWPYDNGGCGCDLCHPWPKTFFDLSKQVAQILRTYHPGADIYLSTWDMTDDEKALLSQLLTEDGPRTFQGIVDKEWMLIDMEDEKPVDSWTKLGLPQDYLRIPYIDLCQIGAWGWHCFTANPYPARFEKMISALRKAGITQYGAYSEDVHDDMNKYLLGRLGQSSKRTSGELIREYCLNYFQAAVGEDVYKAACLMEDEYTNKFKSPWVQKPILNGETAKEMLTILRRVEGRLPDYIVRGFRWQVFIKRAEISFLMWEIGEKETFNQSVENLYHQALDSHSVEVAKDYLRKVLQLIEEKRYQLSELKNIVDDLRTNVLEEPDDRTIYVVNALDSYFDWQKILLAHEQKTVLASRGVLLDRLKINLRVGADQKPDDSNV